MLSFDINIGFPLRLLAREVYDELIQKVNIKNVALITEKKNNSSDAILRTVELPTDGI